MNAPLILGIESTCDETGVAFVRDGKLLADVTASSMQQHARYGGIIPEIASRAHLESFLPALQQSADQAGVTLDQVDAIACAAGPGLIGSLTVGISAAKALALTLGKPLYGVNHVIGHLAVDKLVNGPFTPPFIGLVVSGGHSNLLLVRNLATDIEELGGTLDDAAGEAFDKVGRMLHTPYPGGPHVDKLAAQGDRKAIRFPRGLHAGKDKERHRYDFSFSGLKTAVARYIEGLEKAGEQVNRQNIAAGFSEAVNDSLTAKAVTAALDFGCKQIVVGGGFSANSRLRALLAERASAKGIEVRIPPIRFCTDNGAQIAAIGEELFRAGLAPSPVDFGPDSAMSLSQIYISSDQPLTFTSEPAGQEGFRGEIQAEKEGLPAAVVKNGKEDAEPGLPAEQTEGDLAADAAADSSAGAESTGKKPAAAGPSSDHLDGEKAAGPAASGKAAGSQGPSSEKTAEPETNGSESSGQSTQEIFNRVKENVNWSLEQVKPSLDRAVSRIKPVMDSAEQAIERAVPYAEQAIEKAKPYAEQAIKNAKPYAEQAIEKSRDYAHQAGQKLQEKFYNRNQDSDEPSVDVQPPDDVEPRS